MKIKLPWKTICKKHKRKGLSYMAFIDYAEDQTAKGNKQKQCPDCGYWLFPEEW